MKPNKYLEFHKANPDGLAVIAGFGYKATIMEYDVLQASRKLINYYMDSILNDSAITPAIKGRRS